MTITAFILFAGSTARVIITGFFRPGNSWPNSGALWALFQWFCL